MNTTARSTLVLVLAAVCALGPEHAHAHPIEFGVMTLAEQQDGRFDLELRFSGGEDAREPAAPWLDEECTLDSLVEIPLDYGLHLRGLLRCEGGLVGKRVGVRGLDGTDIEVPLTISRESGDVQSSILSGSHPRERVSAHPSRKDVFGRYVMLGIEHIAIGIDHLLLVLGLLLASRRIRDLVMTITAFTVGHSVTLACASLGLVRVPGPPVEACIALSLVLLAVSLVRKDETQRTSPAILAVTFGLLHGFGFASALTEIGLPQSAIGLALFGFNVGVELGQLAFVALAFVVATVGRRLASEARVAQVQRLLPQAIGAMATYFLLERLGSLGS